MKKVPYFDWQENGGYEDLCDQPTRKGNDKAISNTIGNNTRKRDKERSYVR